MKLHHEGLYGIPAADLFRVFTDRAFYEGRFAKSGEDESVEFVHFGPRGNRFVIDVLRHVRMRSNANIPAIAQRFVRDVNVLHSVMEWDVSPQNDSWHGTYRMEIERMPITVTGRMSIEPRSSGCVHHLAMDIHCSVPLIGGKLAAMVGERAERGMKRDHESTLIYLRENRLVTA